MFKTLLLKVTSINEDKLKVAVNLTKYRNCAKALFRYYVPRCHMSCLA